jgi:uncharacterized protein (PEP-CTERM system associated)
MKNTKWIIFYASIFCLSLASLSWAEFKLVPSIGIREEYNDNIYLTPVNREDDLITSINPAVNVSYKTRLLDLALDYGLNFRFYMDHSERNETSLRQTQRAKLETTVSPYKDIFFIKISDEYTRVPIDVRNQVAIDNVFVNMTDSNRFYINPYMEYPISKTLKTRIGYSYENIWYKAREGDDTQNHSAGISLIKELSPKITTTLSYNYLVHRPQKTEDYDRQDAMLGINYQISEKLSLSGGIGHSWFDHEKRNNSDSAIWNVYAKYLVSDFISLGAGYSENFFDSVNLGTYKSRSLNGSIAYTGKIPLNLTVFRNINKYEPVDREDRSTGLTLTSSIPLTPKITGKLVGNYTYYKFLKYLPEEKVKRYGLGLSFDYALRITTVSAGYTYNWNNSTVDSRDYRNNIVWLQGRFVF